MIRISVTHLESARWARLLDRDLDDLVADLCYLNPPTAKMEAGKALAAFLEHAPTDQAIDVVTRDGWTLDFSGFDGTLPAPAYHELKYKCRVNAFGGPVLLTGKCDGVAGIQISDQKLSDKFDPENYVDSLQWRTYLWMGQAKRFVYDVFVGRIDETRRTVAISDLQPVTFYAYPDMERDVFRAVDDLAALIRRYRRTNEHLAKAFPELPDQEEP